MVSSETQKSSIYFTMNPCATKFTPLSSSEVIETKEDSASDSSSMNFKSADDRQLDNQHTTPDLSQQISDSSNLADNYCTPYIQPSFNISALPDGLHLGSYVVSRLSWNTALWYNHMAVAGSHCPTPPLILPATFPQVYPGPSLHSTELDVQACVYTDTKHLVTVPTVLNSTHGAPIVTGGRDLHTDACRRNGSTPTLHPLPLPMKAPQSSRSRPLSSFSFESGKPLFPTAAPGLEPSLLKYLRPAKSGDTNATRTAASHPHNSSPIPLQQPLLSLSRIRRSKRSGSRDMRRSSDPITRVCDAGDLAVSRRRTKSSETNRHGVGRVGVSHC